MNGIRIKDKSKGIITVELRDILKLIDEDNLTWSIQEFEAVGNLGPEHSVPEIQQGLEDSERGYLVTRKELNVIAEKLGQTIWLYLIGCKNQQDVRLYRDDREMFETCDITIVMFDSAYWEIYAKDQNLLDKLAETFKDTESVTNIKT